MTTDTALDLTRFIESKVGSFVLSVSSNIINVLCRFLHEYSRRHTDFSTAELLRIAEVYKDLLEDCCSRENPASCYQDAVGPVDVDSKTQK